MAVVPPTLRVLSTLSKSFAVTAALLAAPSCAPKGQATPRSALATYTEAIEEGRLEDAYRLLSEETRAELSLAQFKKLIDNNPEEVKELLAAAEKPSQPALLTAEFRAEDGSVLTLIYENGAWRIDQSAVNLYDQTEPRTALEAFVRAYDRKRYDILLEFVPQSQMEGLNEAVLRKSWEGELRLEIEQIVEGLRAHVKTADLELLGDRATMSYGAGGVVELVREQGLWKIEDLK